MIVAVTTMTTLPANCVECNLKMPWVLNCGLCLKSGAPEIKKSCLNKRHKDCPLREIKAETK